MEETLSKFESVADEELVAAFEENRKWLFEHIAIMTHLPPKFLFGEELTKKE